MQNDPWAFGWTQLLTIVSFLITIGIASIGFKSFERWRREKLEEKKIDVAIDALAIAYEAKYVFEAIRSPMSHSFESKDMRKWDGESDEQYKAREPYHAILARIDRNKEFFARLFRLQPKFMALFGADKEPLFMKCHGARRSVEVSAGMLMRSVNEKGEWNKNKQRQHNQWEADIWDGVDDEVEPLSKLRRVSKGIREFQEGIIAVCKPVAERKTSKAAGRFFA